jgi:hypothetical protein
MKYDFFAWWARVLLVIETTVGRLAFEAAARSMSAEDLLLEVSKRLARTGGEKLLPEVWRTILHAVGQQLQRYGERALAEQTYRLDPADRLFVRIIETMPPAANGPEARMLLEHLHQVATLAEEPRHAISTSDELREVAKKWKAAAGASPAKPETDGPP